MPVLALAFLCVGTIASAQVDEIKQKSSEHSKSRSSVSSSEGGGSSSSFGLNFLFQGIGTWQAAKLQRWQEVPHLVSLEVMVQSAVQPSDYYILHPRVRGNWGLFSTDFRFNYLVEEDLEGTRHIRTNDWQILQLNIVSTQNVGFRIGGGVLYEAFGEGNSFGEFTLGLTGQSDSGHLGGMTEYRTAEVRKEWNAHFQYRILSHGVLHGFATLGVVYQRYYDTINVWGIQAGFVLKIHR